MYSSDKRRGKIILLPHRFLRTPELILKAKFPKEPNIVQSLSKRELIESNEEASYTRATYRDFRCRRRISWINDRINKKNKTSTDNVINQNDPLSHLSIHILHTKTSSSFWEIPTCNIWIQDLINNNEWVKVKSLNEVEQLALKIQLIEDAAIDDENAELALNNAVNKAMDREDNHSDDDSDGGRYDQSNFYDNNISKNDSDDGYERKKSSRGFHNSYDDEANWKLEDEEDEEDEGERKGALFQYLLSHGGSNTKHLINKKMPSLLKSTRKGSEHDDDSDKDEVVDEAGSLHTSDVDSLDNVYYEDLSIVGDINKQATDISSNTGLSNSLHAVGATHTNHPTSHTSLSAITSSSTINAVMADGVHVVTGDWESLHSGESKSIQNEDIFKFLRRIIQLSSLFDPSAKEIASEDQIEIKSGRSSKLETKKKKKHVPRKKLTHEDYQNIRRIRARRLKVGRAAGALLSTWLSPGSSAVTDLSSPSSARSSTSTTSIASEVLSSSSSIAAAVMRRSSFTALVDDVTENVKEEHSETPRQTKVSDESLDQVQVTSHSKLSAEIRAYTMGVLSLPPLARLLAGYIDMMITELDDVYAESALSSLSNVSDANNSVQVGVTSSVRSVGKLFTSLFTSVYTDPAPPPPLPPPSPPKQRKEFNEMHDESLSKHIMNYWNDDNKPKPPVNNRGDKLVISTVEEAAEKTEVKLKYAVVRRKAKVREGVEFEKVSSPGGGSLSQAADKVGTLSEGAVVVVLDNAVALDGTRRSKVRGSHRHKEVVGWVTTKLLKPHPGPTKPAEPGTSLLTVQEKPSPGASAQNDTLLTSRIVTDEEIDAFDCGDGPVHKVMDKLTDFMAQTTYLIKECCEEDLLLIVSLHLKDKEIVSMEEAEGIIDNGVWRQVEAEVFMPLQSKLISSLTKHVQLEAARFAQRLRSLKALPQKFWSISDKMISKDSWVKSISLLNKIQFVSLPTDKVDLLLEAVRAIEDEHKSVERKEYSKKGGEDEAPLGADDIFPVFVYVLVQSDLWKGGEVIILRDLLSSLANPERQRWSASAYYVATLEAAIEHIKAT